jgi:rubrerythrin
MAGRVRRHPDFRAHHWRLAVLRRRCRLCGCAIRRGRCPACGERAYDR